MVVEPPLICEIVEVGRTSWAMKWRRIFAETGGDKALGVDFWKPGHSVDRLVEHLFEVLQFSHGVVL